MNTKLNIAAKKLSIAIGRGDTAGIAKAEKELLDVVGTSGVDDGMSHGFPMSREKDYILVKHPDYAFKSANAPLVQIPLNSLQATQHDVGRQDTIFHIEHPRAVPRNATNRSGARADKPVVVKYHGGLHIVDGHHRLAAAKLLGKASMRVRLVDLDSP